MEQIAAHVLELSAARQTALQLGQENAQLRTELAECRLKLSMLEGAVNEAKEKATTKAEGAEAPELPAAQPKPRRRRNGKTADAGAS